MTIDAVHGVVYSASRDLFNHRNLLDIETFSTYLANRPPYGPLATSIVNGNDALTLDDSTFAAAEAALIARKLEHCVTLFVNGYNISSGMPYSFSRLNAALDDACRVCIEYEGKHFDLQTTTGKQVFRKAVKSKLLMISEEDGRQDFITTIGQLLGVRDIVIPPYLLPITERDLNHLMSKGVDIQNHGWMHAGIAALTPASLSDNIHLGQKWLQSRGTTADMYAIPNGDGLPSVNSPKLWKAWFLLDDSLPIGEVRPGVFNRRTLLV
jgi:hypothetical protein